MNYRFDESFLQKLIGRTSNKLVGELCKKIECLQKDLDNKSNEYRYLSHAKALHKETVYETFRDLENELKAYQSGRKFTKFTIYTPTDSQESA